MQRFCSSTLNEHVCFQIKRKQVFKQLLEVLPRMIGRKKKGGGAIFVPHLFQTWMLQMMTQICAVRYYWYSSHRFSANWLQAGQGGGGVFSIDRHFQIQTQTENEGVEVVKLERISICLLGLHACAAALMLTHRRKEVKFVFVAIYRQERCPQLLPREQWHINLQPAALTCCFNLSSHTHREDR